MIFKRPVGAAVRTRVEIAAENDGKLFLFDPLTELRGGLEAFPFITAMINMSIPKRERLSVDTNNRFQPTALLNRRGRKQTMIPFLFPVRIRNL